MDWKKEETEKPPKGAAAGGATAAGPAGTPAPTAPAPGAAPPKTPFRYGLNAAAKGLAPANGPKAYENEFLNQLRCQKGVAAL